MKKISGSSHCCFVISLVLVWGASAAAQHTSESLGGTFDNPAGATITKTIMNRIAQRNRERRPPARRSGPGSAAPASSSNSGPTVAKLNEASVLFRPTGTQLKTREIANVIAAGNPQVFKLLTALLEEFDKGARAAGHPNDLALALSFFLATNASIYHGAGQPPDPPMVELRNIIAEALVEANALNGVTDRKKQEMYETLVLCTGFTLAVYEEGKQGGNAETIKTSQQLAGQNLQAVIGISPDKITFTDQGLAIETEPAAAIAMASPSATEPTQGAPSETINAGKLVIEFEGNEVRANQIYGGKRIRVNGTVNSIDILKDGRITLTFHSPAMGYAHTRCYFDKSQSSRLAELKGGQEAIVEGTVRGFNDSLRGYVELENCIVP